MTQPMTFTLNPTVPFEGDISKLFLFGPLAIPFEYTGWRSETMAWIDSAYIGTALSLITPTYMIKGPDTLKFLSDYFVNNFKNFPVGKGKHGIMCTEEGLVMMDGVIIRTAEDEVITYWLAPYIHYVFEKEKGRYDAEGVNLSGTKFFFQIAGPRSLEILEAASGDDLHDIGFMRHRLTQIAGKQVRILRMGMAGTLAYEVHGEVADGQDVYKAINTAGQAYGMKKLGTRAYMMDHTQGGFPQAYYHFPYPWHEDEGLVEFMKNDPTYAVQVVQPDCVGSMGPDVGKRYRNPVELGWSKMINFNHDFVGRSALEELVANPNRKMVTLEWKVEDIVDIYASQFRDDDEPYQNMDAPNDQSFEMNTSNPATYHADQVLKGDKCIGISSGRVHNVYYRRMISLASINTEFSGLGTEVEVLWGNPGARQKKVRATVARFPYMNEGRNQVVDVNEIPRLKG